MDSFELTYIDKSSGGLRPICEILSQQFRRYHNIKAKNKIKQSYGQFYGAINSILSFDGSVEKFSKNTHTIQSAVRTG